MSDSTLSSSPVFNFTFRVKCIILLAIGLVFYANTIYNQYALDDGIVITQNQFVQEGFDGIGGIMSKDAYYSYYHKMNANQMLAGGRYRPLSIVVFAIEHQFFGENTYVRHAVSILAYMLCILVVFFFLNNYLLKKLPGGEDIAFLASVLFAIHPMHTEVVANVKSLDEIISLIFIMLTFIYALRYAQPVKLKKGEKKSNKDLYLGALFYMLALLSKEYAILLLFMLPLLFYLAASKKPGEALMASLPYYGVAVLYLFMRYQSVGIPHNVPSDEILNNPYLRATHPQKIASEIFVLGKYLYMLFIPYPLSSDYSYNTLPYRNFSDPLVLLTLLIYIGLIYMAIRLTLKRNILAFPLFFYLTNLAMVSNFLIDIGATMGERLAFHSSVGFVVLLAYGIMRLPLPQKKTVITAFLSLLIIACAAEVWPRNAQWKNDITLFTHDVYVVPNSIMVNGNAGARFLDMAGKKENAYREKSLTDTAIYFLKKSIRMHKTYTNSYLNLGIAYYKLQMPDSAKYYWDIARRLYPDHPSLKEYYPLLAQSYLNKGLELGHSGHVTEAIEYLKKGLREDTKNPGLWYNLGGAYFTEKYWDSARYCWMATLSLHPDSADAINTRRGLGALPPPGKDTIKGIR